MSDSLPQELSPEEEELAKIREKWIRYPKLSRWFDLYFDASNKELFGKQTECAIIAYELDPADPHDRKTAYEIASQNSRKLKMWAQKYFENAGWTKEKVLDLIAAKAVSTNNAKFTLMLAELTDTYEEKPKVSIQNNTQINNIVQVTPEEEARLDKEFADFMNTKARTAVSIPSQPDVSTQNTG